MVSNDVCNNRVTLSVLYHGTRYPRYAEALRARTDDIATVRLARVQNKQALGISAPQWLGE